MARTTLLDELRPYASFASAVDVGVALSGAWRQRAGNEAAVMGRIMRLLTRVNAGQLSAAAAESRRVVDLTSTVINDIDLLSSIDTATRTITDGEADARDALLALRRHARALGQSLALGGGPNTPDVAGLSDADIAGAVRAMRRLGATDAAAVERSVRAQVQARVRADHAHVLLGAARRRGSSFPGVTATDGDLRRRATTLRDGIRTAARTAPNGDAAWFVALADVVAAYERDWLTDVGDPCIALLVAGSDPSAAVSVRRSAALAYDAVRLGLAWLAGGYELLFAWARADNRALREWASRSSLPLDSGVLDLPRAEVRSVASGGVPVNSSVEVSGVVTAAASEVQAGRVRTVLRLDDTLTVYFPFSAVDGFGILPGVWGQVRGVVLDESKGGYPPPTVRVRRRKLGDAARLGFGEYLEFQGRSVFDRVRAGDDAITGRLAHDARSATEATDWN